MRFCVYREQVGKATVELRYCSTEEMVADMLTKGFEPGPVHKATANVWSDRDA